MDSKTDRSAVAIESDREPFVPSVDGVDSAGVGVGSAPPGWCGSPAEAEAESRHTSASVSIDLLTVVSPVVEAVEVDGRVPAVTVHDTPQTDPDVVRFCALTCRGDFDGAAQLCRERLLTARDEAQARRWTKDRSIVESLRGNFTAAYELLASVHWSAQRAEGTPRGKYELEFGIVHARLGRSSLALDRFGAAFQHHRRAGGVFACAQVDTARARCLVTRGETAKALRYLSRAEQIATQAADFHLLGEIAESRALAYEAEGRYAEAEESAFLSIQLISGTGDRTALAESTETWQRVFKKARSG